MMKKTKMAHLTKSTKAVKGKEIVRHWHVVDVKKKVLGSEQNEQKYRNTKETKLR